jgi:hypothetical protein
MFPLASNFPNVQRDSDRSKKVESFPYGLFDEIFDSFVESWYGGDDIPVFFSASRSRIP